MLRNEKMKQIKLVLLVPFIFLTCGCATPIKYNLGKGIYEGENPTNYTLAVDVFQDLRPSGESDGTIVKDKGPTFVSTQDKNFTPDIDRQISGMLVEHLNKANIFKQVELRDVDNAIYSNSGLMSSLNAEGIDLVMLGNLSHFYGYMDMGASTIAAVAFGLVGALTEAIINHKTVGANVEYSDMKIIDLRNKQIIWEGNIGHEYEEKVVFYDSPVAYSLRGLREANNKFAEKLDDIMRQEITKEVNLPKEEQIAEVRVSDSDVLTNYAQYYRFLYNKISGYVVKPEGSGSGVINVAFTLLSDGTLEDINILEGSADDPLLREAVLSAIKKSAPFPVFPDDIKGEAEKTFTITLEFKYR